MVQKMKFPNRLSLFRSPGSIALLLIALILCVQYGAAWYGIEMARVSKETDFNSHLQVLGEIAQLQLRDPAVELAELAAEIDEQFGEEPGAAAAGPAPMAVAEFASGGDTFMRSPFEDFVAKTRLRNLTLLDHGGRVLYRNGLADENLLAPFDFLEIDREQFDRALHGSLAESLAYSVDSGPVKRVYVPIYDLDGHSIAGVLCLTAGRDYLGTLSKLSQNLRLLSMVSTLLVLIVGLIVYRLVARQREYERRAAHTDRLSSLGSLAAGFAHEIRNPLEIISACTEDLERSLARERASEPLESCRDILEEVDRMNHLVSQFLQYSRADGAGGAAGSAEIGPSIGSVLAMLRHAAEKKGVTLVWEQAESLNGATVAIADGGLRQIVINLVMNAVEAAPEGGRVELVARLEPRRLRLQVHDDGPGVAPGLRSRIFDPFFTTRAEGSGLGLAIAHQLAARAGGKLICEELPRTSGACFTLTLPLGRSERTVAREAIEALGR